MYLVISFSTKKGLVCLASCPGTAKKQQGINKKCTDGAEPQHVKTI